MTYAKITHTTFMSEEKVRHIYVPEDFSDESTAAEYYDGPIKMGREKEFFQRCNKISQEFIIKNNSDLESEEKKPIDTSRQLFGISNQNISERVSLDEKFPGQMLYKIKTDNMTPLFHINTYVMLRFCDFHQSGAICVYRYKGKDYINQIKFVNKKVVAISFNKKYKPYYLDPDEYHFIAVVNSFHGSVTEALSANENLI